MASKKNQNKKGANKKPEAPKANRMQKIMSGVKEFWGQKSPVLKFLLGFAGCMILFYIIYLSPFFIEYIGKPIINGEAKVGSILLNILGQGTQTTADLIHNEHYSISVKNGCDGLEPLAILLSGILVFPVQFRLKLRGILWGFLALMILNFLRITGLYLAGRYLPEWVFDVLHEQGGFVIFTALSIFIWMVWANWAMKNSVSTANSQQNSDV